MTRTILHLFWISLLLISAPEAKLKLAFLGITANDEPVAKRYLEKIIFRRLKTRSNYELESLEMLDLYGKIGVIQSPENLVPKNAKALADRIGSRLLIHGVLNRMDYTMKRQWWKPWNGIITYSHSLWLEVYDGYTGEVRYSGLLTASHTDRRHYIGWGRKTDFIEAQDRYDELKLLLNDLAGKTVKMVHTSVKGLDNYYPDDKGYAKDEQGSRAGRRPGVRGDSLQGDQDILEGIPDIVTPQLSGNQRTSPQEPLPETAPGGMTAPAVSADSAAAANDERGRILRERLGGTPPAGPSAQSPPPPESQGEEPAVNGLGEIDLDAFIE